jgi:hypothetical protein
MFTSDIDFGHGLFRPFSKLKNTTNPAVCQVGYGKFSKKGQRMHWFLQVPGQAAIAIDRPKMRIGSDPGSDIYLAHPDLAEAHAVLHSDDHAVWLEPLGQPVHVNGRRVLSAALVRPGDDLHFGSVPVRIQTEKAPALEASSGGVALNFSGRVVLRALTGSDVGRAYALMNSLCIGRSVLSEIRIDDLALAERQVLVQRQGNHIVVKNLSPVLEMRVDGWSCTEARLTPNSQLCIEQHRFLLEAPFWNVDSVGDPQHEQVPESLAEPEPVAEPPPFFSKTQWLLLAAAIAISGLIVLLLTLAP